MATIVRRESGKWQAKVRRLGAQPVSRTFSRRSDAEAWARQAELDAERGGLVDRGALERLTLAGLLGEYKVDVASRQKSGPIAAYRIARLSEDLGHLRLTAVTPAVVAAWRDNRLRAVAPATVARELGTLSAALSWAAKEKMLPLQNPVALIRKPPEPRGRDRRLGPGEEVRLFEALEDRAAQREDGKLYRVGARNPWLLPLVQFALETAMRQGELLALRWVDIDLARQVAILHETKNGESRQVPLSRRACSILAGLLRSEDGRVFPISAQAVKLAWRRAASRAGLNDLNFHDLRHEATSRLAEKLPNVIELAAVTGHKDLRMLKRYYHPRPEDLAAKLG